MDFPAPADHRVKLKEIEKKDNCQDLARELTNLFGWLVGFYGISTFVGYLTPNSFLYK